MSVYRQVAFEVQGGVVDECGVCGGLSTSCAILVNTQLQVIRNAKRVNQTLQVPAANLLL